MFYCLKLGASANKAMNCRPVLSTLCFEMLVCSVGCIGKRAKALHKCIIFAKIHMKARRCLLRVFEDVVLPVCTLRTEFVGKVLQFCKMGMTLVVWSVGRCRIACVSVGSESGKVSMYRVGADLDATSSVCKNARVWAPLPKRFTLRTNLCMASSQCNVIQKYTDAVYVCAELLYKTTHSWCQGLSCPSRNFVLGCTEGVLPLWGIWKSTSRLTCVVVVPPVMPAGAELWGCW